MATHANSIPAPAAGSAVPARVTSIFDMEGAVEDAAAIATLLSHIEDTIIFEGDFSRIIKDKVPRFAQGYRIFVLTEEEVAAMRITLRLNLEYAIACRTAWHCYSASERKAGASA